MGDANASIPTVQPFIGRPMWGSQPSAAVLNSVVWVSQASIDIGKCRVFHYIFVPIALSPWGSRRLIQGAIDLGTMNEYGIRKKPVAVKGCRSVSKKDMKWNDAMPKMSGESLKSWLVLGHSVPSLERPTGADTLSLSRFFPICVALSSTEHPNFNGRQAHTQSMDGRARLTDIT